MSENALLKALHETIAPARVYTDQQTLSVLARDALHPGRLPGWSVAQPLCVFRDVLFNPIERSGSQRSQKIHGAKAAFAFDGKIWRICVAGLLNHVGSAF